MLSICLPFPFCLYLLYTYSSSSESDKDNYINYYLGLFYYYTLCLGSIRILTRFVSSTSSTSPLLSSSWLYLLFLADALLLRLFFVLLYYNDNAWLICLSSSYLHLFKYAFWFVIMPAFCYCYYDMKWWLPITPTLRTAYPMFSTCS